MMPAYLTLETSRVHLRPFQEEDRDAFLLLASQDQEMWNYFSLNLSDEQQLHRWMQNAFADKQTGTRMPFAIVDRETGQIAGSSSMGNISYYDLRLEIGWSWLGPAFRSTGLNLHAKFAMMRYAFEELDFERVEFKTDVLNARARKGLEKVGGVEEGILRSHMTMWNDRRRTSVYYSVLKNEWPILKTTIFAGIV
ncbi:MAG: GNAT family N-acetyltransferase [Chitinophagaceae bacterium]